ncbi:MAG: hypothetical protein K9M96_05230 [Deltaproteobacteria bacterium]|nr:hypothetical protein [Deltaproteobacteria bacterium]
MTIEAVGRFRRVSKQLEQISLQLMEDLKVVWDKDAEASEALSETREALAEIQGTMNILDVAVNRLDKIRVRDRRKHLHLVRG